MAAHPEILVTSSFDGGGIPEARAALSTLAREDEDDRILVDSLAMKI